ncbi:protein XRI1 isoform X1 [Andrographis paniculata]|uniref:protein XRI1 isoform X1 n=1 Tax=Andrographis paniculata TaxID=175694 RepID=UPI0021E89A87|nr:protein XRI1 isoform X1 [Andrographis paniculata]
MSCDRNMWDWQGQEYCLEDNSSIEISKSLFDGTHQNAEDMSSLLDSESTPLKACGDLAYHTPSNELTGKVWEQQDLDPASQLKRRRMLQFEPEALEENLGNDDMFLKSKETKECLEDALSEMTQWVAGFSEENSISCNECLDPSAEGWIADCFNDAEMHFCTEDINASGESDVQIDITDLCSEPPEYDTNIAEPQPVNTHPNVVFKGRKPYIRAPPKISSSIVYPFAFIKPCGAHGDMTLKDINEKIHNPPKSKPREDPPVAYPTSAFSGKPVVGKTKIHTEGGKGSITIMRTKG